MKIEGSEKKYLSFTAESKAGNPIPVSAKTEADAKEIAKAAGLKVSTLKAVKK